MSVGGMVQIRSMRYISSMSKITDMAGDGIMSYVNTVIKACMPQINIMPYVNTVAKVNIMSDICSAMIRTAIVPA